MSLLSDFEDRVSRAVEGGFARVFRSPVQPAELAKAVGQGSRPWPQGRRRQGLRAHALQRAALPRGRREPRRIRRDARRRARDLPRRLRARALLHAGRPSGRALHRRPRAQARTLRHHRRAALPRGTRRGARRGVRGRDPAAPAADKVGPSSTPRRRRSPSWRLWASLGSRTRRTRKLSIPIIKPGLFFDAEAEDSDDLGAPAPGIATITVRGVDHDVVLRGDRMVVGRLSSCEICLQDKNTSRQHAAFVRGRRRLGGRRPRLDQRHARQRAARSTACTLRDDDVIVVGITELIYHEPRG